MAAASLLLPQLLLRTWQMLVPVLVEWCWKGLQPADFALDEHQSPHLRYNEGLESTEIAEQVWRLSWSQRLAGHQ